MATLTELNKMLELVVASRNNLLKLNELEETIKMLIAEKYAVKKGGTTEKKRLKNAEKYIKRCVKIMPFKQALHGAWMQNGKQYLSNGFTGIELIENSIIENVTQVQDDIKTYDLAKIIYDAKNNSDKEQYVDLIALKMQLAEAKAEAKANNVELKKVEKSYIDIGEARYNIELILEIVGLFPSENLKYYNSSKNQPLIIVDDKGNTAIVSPVL